MEPNTKDQQLSSPDPLGMSNGKVPSRSPAKAGRRPSITPRKALIGVSGNAQVQEFYINTPPNPRRNASPTKSPRQTTQSTSPWRIRLTVQAEQVNEMQRLKTSPTKRHTERTTTTTVPLKGGDDTPQASEKKGRGRPRKSLDSPVKRTGTPKPKIGGRPKTMPESLKDQEMSACSETDTPPKKPRGRPRKSVEPKHMQSSHDMLQRDDLDVWLGSSLAGGEETAEQRKNTRKRSRGRRQEITPVKVAMDSDIESQSSSADIVRDPPKEVEWTLGNMHDERGQLDQQSHQSYESPISQVEQRGESRWQSAIGQQHDEGWQPMNHCETSSAGPHGDDAQNQTEDVVTGQYQEHDSILESEGFSMVSVSSLASVGDNLISPTQQHGSLHERTPTISSSPSVPPVPENAKVPSSPRQLEVPSEGTPRLEKVVRAGIALQGVLSPKDESQKLGSPFQESQKPSSFLTVDKTAPYRGYSRRLPQDKSPEERSDDLFRGFGAGTRRELKAGLRLGEELAKRQRQNSQQSLAGLKEKEDIFRQRRDSNDPQRPACDSKEAFILKPSESERQVKYPLISNNQLPSPERSLVDEDDRKSWKADTPIKYEEPVSRDAQSLVSVKSIGPNASAIDDTMIARKEEWQREREAVSKQIEMANKSQVIIIDSDDEGEEQERDPEDGVADCDIWQAAAQFVDQSRETTPEASIFLQQPEVLKPRRSNIPSPWRRNSQVIYRDEVEPTESDLFWQPDQSQARDSRRRNARKSQTPQHLDIPKEIILDNSMENARMAEAQLQLEVSNACPVKSLHLSNDEDDNIATSADCTQDHDSMQDADQNPKSPAVLTPKESHTVPVLPPTLVEAFTEDVIEVSDKTATLEVTEGTPDEPTLQNSKDSKIVIDPRLLRKKIHSSSTSNHPTIPIRPLQPLQPSTSWLSRVTAPIWSVFAPAATLLPAATKEDILCSSPHEPLCQLTPWEECHFRALGPLYYGSLLYGAHLFPFNPRSPSARYCGAYVTTKHGWSRKITPEDCGITDAFMILLDERGFALGEPGARWIDEGMVIAMCVALWVGMVKRGEVEADRSKGERIGLRDQGDRKWTKDDIDWASNESAYFERKRREFDGLPSWKDRA